MATDPPPARRALAVALAAVFAGICMAPGWMRLANPTLYADDVVRVVDLQTRPLGSLLFRPINEHMAPLFESVTWASWALAGHRPEVAPLAFVLASIVPFALASGLVGLVARRELDSPATAWAASACFALASIDGEVVNWYSASSFTWALAATLAAWLGAIEGLNRRRVGWLVASAFAAMVAPAFCAIGLLAGPLAALRLASDGGGSSRGRRWAGALAPVAGTVAYLGFCELFRYRDLLASGLSRNGVGWSTALWNLGRAPVDVLVPGLLGIRNLDRSLPDPVELALSAMIGLALIAWAWASPRRRPLVLCGLALIVGGYGSTYGVRTLPDPRQVLDVQRYHLFPHLGLVLLIAPVLRLGLRRLDDRPVLAPVAGIVLALALLGAHRSQMREHLRFFRFPEQPPTLAALARLESTCRRLGVTRDQVLRSLDPIRPTWAPGGGNALELLPTMAKEPNLPDASVRPALLSGLTPEDRDALCGGMDASTYRILVVENGGSPASMVGRSRVEPDGQGLYRSAGWPAYLEYRLGPEADDARALALADVRSGRDVELWWADESGPWSPNRVAWWRPDPGRDWAVPLDRLPHWPKGHVRRLRVYFHEPGLVAAGTPRMLR